MGLRVGLGSQGSGVWVEGLGVLGLGLAGMFTGFIESRESTPYKWESCLSTWTI